MIALETLIWLFLFLLGAGLILALLHYLVVYCEREFPANPLLFKAARILLVVGAVLILISVVLHLMGMPLVTWRR